MKQKKSRIQIDSLGYEFLPVGEEQNPESDGHTVGGVWFALLAVKRISEIMNIPQWSIL